ncbi:TPA: hypothetical protein NKO30_005969 [Pseudomonas aeruginosa]|nr:hypothetical protein [Pseudomonas aeruginosa]
MDRTLRWQWLLRPLFWALTVAAASIVGLFLWAAAPLVLTLARGGHGALWFFGAGAPVLAAAGAYLLVAACIVVRRRTKKAHDARADR